MCVIIGRTVNMSVDVSVVNPRDPNQIGISTVNRFISSYVNKVLGADSVGVVVANTIMCRRTGEAIFGTIDMKPDMNSRELVRLNMNSLAGVLSIYNMSLSVLRFSVDDEERAPGMFMDPDAITMMKTGRFMNDPAFVYRIRNGLPLVSDRRMMLAKGNVIRRRRKIMARSSNN